MLRLFFTHIVANVKKFQDTKNIDLTGEVGQVKFQQNLLQQDYICNGGSVCVYSTIL